MKIENVFELKGTLVDDELFVVRVTTKDKPLPREYAGKDLVRVFELMVETEGTTPLTH